MWISPAYSREYQVWIADGQFDRIYSRELPDLTEAIELQHPALVATSLGTLATCYYRRGIVRLLQNVLDGWRDIQLGYQCAFFGLHFDLKAVSLPAWSQGRSFAPRRMTELVLTFGLARLFGQDRDVKWLSESIAKHFSLSVALGDRFPAGRKLLESILEPAAQFTVQELLQDRKDCCIKRDAWPTRPTEIDPFGVLDIETAIRFPSDSAFRYEASYGFQPTEDGNIIEALRNYDRWYG